MANSVKRLLSLSRDSLRESLFRNIGVPYRNMIGLWLGVTASFLPLITGVWIMRWVVWVFVGTLVLTMFLLVLVRPNVKKDSDQFAWGLLVIITLGFGLGALIYQAKPWWIWLWRQYLRINEPPELLLEALFLLGIIMGFFVVRNWAQEQKDFVLSLSGVLGGAFVATILGDLQEELTPLRAFAYYALGFTISGSLNLIFAARLTAIYTNKGTMTSRAILDFLYGSERARTIDGYFLKHFEEDPDYAKKLLGDAVDEYRTLARREFAEKFEERRQQRLKERFKFKEQLRKKQLEKNPTEEPSKEPIQELHNRQKRLEPACRDLHTAHEELKRVETEIAKRTCSKQKSPDLSRLRERAADLQKSIDCLKCDAEQLKEWQDLEGTLAPLKPSYFYQMIAVERSQKDSPGAPVEDDPEYKVTYKYIGPESYTKSHHTEERSAIRADMFRVGVAVRRQDVLEYLLAPGAYRAAFPYMGSVAGLALLLPHTIVMNRDIDITFRSKDYKDGIRPRDIEQGRGRDIIDYPSYVSIPIVSHLGTPQQNPLGIVNIDTKLFVTRFKLNGKPVKGERGIFCAPLKRSELEEFASNLYEQNDVAVEYLKELTKAIIPVLELYAKCRIGAT